MPHTCAHLEEADAQVLAGVSPAQVASHNTQCQPQPTQLHHSGGEKLISVDNFFGFNVDEDMGAKVSKQSVDTQQLIK